MSKEEEFRRALRRLEKVLGLENRGPSLAKVSEALVIVLAALSADIDIAESK